MDSPDFLHISLFGVDILKSIVGGLKVLLELSLFPQ